MSDAVAIAAIAATASSVAAIATSYTAIKMKQLEKNTNSKMTAVLEATKTTYRAEGVMAGAAEQKAKTDGEKRHD